MWQATVLLLGVLTAVNAATLGREEARPAHTERLAIIMGFANGYSTVVLEEMKREVESVLVIPGLTIEWRELDTSAHQEVFDHVVVARFRGECRAMATPATKDLNGTLGATHISDGVIIPFADIDCSKVQRLVQAAVVARNQTQSELLLGRALARVLAHELFHILAETTRHSRHGIAQSALSPFDLTEGRLRFERQDLEAIQRKVMIPPRLPAQPEVVAAGGG
jgi:hypothetical protein